MERLGKFIEKHSPGEHFEKWYSDESGAETIEIAIGIVIAAVLIAVVIAIAKGVKGKLENAEEVINDNLDDINP